MFHTVRILGATDVSVPGSSLAVDIDPQSGESDAGAVKPDPGTCQAGKSAPESHLPDALEQAAQKFEKLQRLFDKHHSQYIIESGKLLLKAKQTDEGGKHGCWLRFLDRIGINNRTAQKHMRADQQPERLERLGLRKALALAQMPDDQAAQLEADNDLASIPAQHVEALVAKLRSGSSNPAASAKPATATASAPEQPAASDDLSIPNEQSEAEAAILKPEPKKPAASAAHAVRTSSTLTELQAGADPASIPVAGGAAELEKLNSELQTVAVSAETAIRASSAPKEIDFVFAACILHVPLDLDRSSMRNQAERNYADLLDLLAGTRFEAGIKDAIERIRKATSVAEAA